MGPVRQSSTRLVLILLPFVVMAALTVSRIVVGPGAGLLPLISLGPAFAATLPGVRHTLAVGMVALSLATVLAFAEPPPRNRLEITAFGAVIGVAAASVVASMARQRADRELADVRAIAEVAQQVLLGPVPAQVGPIEVAVRYAAAASQARIGGDLYEVLCTPAGLRIIVGDVQGKGLGAVRLAGAALCTFRERAHSEPSLAAVAARIEARLARLLTDEEFVTAVLAEITADGASVTLLNCGHPRPLLVGADGVRFLGPASGDLPLGLTALGQAPRRAVTTALAPGDRLLLYTDGVSEARNKAGAFFPLAESDSLGASGSAENVMAALGEEFARHIGRGRPEDDAAMLLIRRKTAAGR